VSLRLKKELKGANITDLSIMFLLSAGSSSPHTVSKLYSENTESS